MQYAGFWKRFFSLALDFIILMPVSILILWVESFSKNIHMLFIIPHAILYLGYNIYMNAAYGGTCGKLIAGIRITKTNGEKIYYKEAFLRNIVDLVLGLTIVVMQVYALLNISEPSYNTLSWIKKTGYLQKNMPEFAEIARLNYIIWIWGELFVLLLNKKKRALHDFIAGTVVVDLRKKKDIHDITIDEKLDRILSNLDE